MSKQAFEQFRKDLITGLNASQEWQASKASGSADTFIKSDASAVITQDRFIQYGLYYTPFIEAGRPPNEKNSGGLVEGIYKWLAYKKYDITYDSEEKRQTISENIARSIAKNGSFKFRENKQTDVFGSIIKKATPSLLKALAEDRAAQLSSEVGEEIKRINEIKR